MSKIIIKKYKCDICGKEVEKETDLRKETVPCYGEGSFFTQTSVDMCDDCASRLRKIIYQNFAEIRDNYGLTVKQVFKKDDNSQFESDKNCFLSSQEEINKCYKAVKNMKVSSENGSCSIEYGNIRISIADNRTSCLSDDEIRELCKTVLLKMILH